jgi:uncharacterized membrane protein (DUF106 family)
MMKKGERKKKKYRIRKVKPFNVKKLILIITGFSLLVVMIILISTIDYLPDGPLFKSIIQKSPESMIFILLISLTINLSTTMLGKALIDTGEMQRKTKLIKDHNAEKKEVEKLKDVDFKQYQKRMIKVKRLEASVKKMQQNIGMQRIRPSCVTVLPIFILWWAMAGLFNAPTVIAIGTGFWFNVIPGGSVGVAKMVMNPYPELSFLASYLFPGPNIAYWGSRGFISFTAFYYLSSASIGVIVQRASGLGTSGMGGFGGIGNLTGMSGLK